MGTSNTKLKECEKNLEEIKNEMVDLDYSTIRFLIKKLDKTSTDPITPKEYEIIAQYIEKLEKIREKMNEIATKRMNDRGTDKLVPSGDPGPLLNFGSKKKTKKSKKTNKPNKPNKRSKKRSKKKSKKTKKKEPQESQESQEKLEPFKNV